jgi:outer membrane protein
MACKIAGYYYICALNLYLLYMKNLSLGLNIVLLVAVGVLYYLHFAPKGNQGSTDSVSASGATSIAYVNADSVLKYYEYLKDNKVVLEEKTKKMDSDFRNRAQSLQGEIAAYQRNASNYTIGQARALEEDLTKKQQNLQLYQQSLSQELMNEEAKLNKELYDRITNFLKIYGKENGLQLVLKFDPSSDVLYGVESLDITTTVVKGLNDSYKTEKEGAATKK